ncbi:hypothetical protein JCM5350_007090 [Sporobolomyces pararoseus]
MPAGACCELILILIALGCPPLAVILYNFVDHVNLCNGATGLNLALYFGAALYAIMTVCSCTSSSQSMRELGKSRKRGAGGGPEGGEKEIPAHLNVQSSYMICDCRGQKSKNGLFKVRVPRGLARKRKTEQVGEAEASSLSSDESFEVGKEHMRRAMMPYVGKETVRRSSFDDDSTTDEELDGRGDDAKYGRSQGGQRSRQNSALSV